MPCAWTARPANCCMTSCSSRERNPQWVHQMNSYASPTPVIEQGRVYCHFGTFGTVAVDTEKASVLWRNSDLHLMHENGPGSSPVLWKDKVIFPADGSDVQFVAALNKDTGAVAWRTERSAARSWTKCPSTTPPMRRLLSWSSPAGPLAHQHRCADWLIACDPTDEAAKLWKAKDALWHAVVSPMGSRPSPRGMGMPIFMERHFLTPLCRRHSAMAWNQVPACGSETYTKRAPTTSSSPAGGWAALFCERWRHRHLP